MPKQNLQVLYSDIHSFCLMLSISERELTVYEIETPTVPHGMAALICAVGIVIP
jgi:hypothetical protein